MRGLVDLSRLRNLEELRLDGDYLVSVRVLTSASAYVCVCARVCVLCPGISARRRFGVIAKLGPCVHKCVRTCMRAGTD